MIKLQGKYNEAVVYTDNVDSTTIAQIIELCNQPFVAGEDIRIMPDCHAGAGCVIGTTMTLRNKKVVPNLVGVDIGCGVRVSVLENKKVDLNQLDKVIRENIPSGFAVRNTPIKIDAFSMTTHAEIVNKHRQELSMGTLGGGNHFIELNVDDEGVYYLVIHTGSRNFGKQIAEYWQEIAIENCPDVKQKSLAYLEGDNFRKYIEDMDTAQIFAEYNRMTIADIIEKKMNFSVEASFTSVHNYINFRNWATLEDGMLRKGAISAPECKMVIIPINMRDGSILAWGKGNSAWNNSAPHGAGRILSRGDAKRKITMEEYEETMKGIFSTSVNLSTLDESPMAYKSFDEIYANITETVDVYKVIKPVYNFKCSSGE